MRPKEHGSHAGRIRETARYLKGEIWDSLRAVGWVALDIGIENSRYPVLPTERATFKRDMRTGMEQITGNRLLRRALR